MSELTFNLLRLGYLLLLWVFVLSAVAVLRRDISIRGRSSAGRAEPESSPGLWLTPGEATEATPVNPAGFSNQPVASAPVGFAEPIPAPFPAAAPISAPVQAGTPVPGAPLVVVGHHGVPPLGNPAASPGWPVPPAGATPGATPGATAASTAGAAAGVPIAVPGHGAGQGYPAGPEPIVVGPQAPPPTQEPKYLAITAGALAGSRLPLSGQPITIGRAPSNTLVFEDDYASSHHARLYPTPHGWVLEDLNSTNGTLLAGEPLTGSALLPVGVPVTIGHSEIKLVV